MSLNKIDESVRQMDNWNDVNITFTKEFNGVSPWKEEVFLGREKGFCYYALVRRTDRGKRKLFEPTETISSGSGRQKSITKIETSPTIVTHRNGWMGDYDHWTLISENRETRKRKKKKKIA